jgi:hypothetical protein
VDIPRHIFEPFHAIARGALQLEDLDLALLMVRAERAVQIRGRGHVAGQGDGILHRELRARADGEVRRVRGVANQNRVVLVPALAHHAIEIEPRRPAQVIGIALQPVAAKIAPKEPLAERDRLFGVELVEPLRGPGFLPGLHDHRREILAELVGVDLEPAMLGLLEGEREGGELLSRAEPDEAALAHVDIGLERGRMAAAGPAVHAVRGDDEVGVPEV